MKIGNVQIENNVFLAPMAGVTDMPFRILCKRQGCALVYSEMVSAKGIHYKNENTKDLLVYSEEEKPLAVQIFGSDPNTLAETAKFVADKGAEIVDINMGCPAPKIVRNNDGCALMRNPELVKQIVKSVTGAVKIPVTVKIRKGWDDDSINALEIAAIAEAAGAAALTIHGRTREQFYSGKADWDIIRQVKKILTIPVIGNGDITGPLEAERMLMDTGCDAIMIGRGAQGNPWIFRRIIEYLKTGNIISEPDYEDRIHTIIEHLKMLVVLKGENIGVKEMRKHIAWYLKGIPNSACIKNMVFTLNKVEEIEKIMSEYKEKLALLK